METPPNQPTSKFEPIKLDFSYDLRTAKFEVDRMQNDLIQDYIRIDQRFKRAFYTDKTQTFIEFLKDKARLQEPIHLSTSGTIRGGKTLLQSDTILMANGEWKMVKDVKIGEEVISLDKEEKVIFSTITNINKYHSKDVYDVFEKNRQGKKLYTCTSNHLIPVFYSTKRRVSKIRNASRKYEWSIKEFTAEELSQKRDYLINANYLGITSFPIQKYKNAVNCKIEPYCLGVYLGDGSLNNRSLRVHNSNADILNHISKYYKIMSIQHRKAKTIPFIAIICYSINSKFAKLLVKYGLYGKKSRDKFIPKEALLSDINYRTKLLAGLIDTDGYIRKNGNISISTKSKQLAQDISDLTYSLGGRASIRPITKSIKSLGFKGNYFNVNIYIQCNLPLKNKFKKSRITKKYAYNSSNRLAIKVKRAKSCKVVGIEIDSPSRWFLTNNWNVTHNSHSMMSVCFLLNYFHKRIIDVRYITANSFEFLQNLQEMSMEDLKNSCFQIDEEKNVFGVGSLAKKTKLTDVQNIIAKNNISTISICPTRFSNKDAFYGLRAFGRDFSQKVNRFMLYNLQEGERGSIRPTGMIYIPIITKLVPEHISKSLIEAYEKKKDEWIARETRGEGDVLYQIKRKTAEHFSKDSNYHKLKKKDEKIVYISQKLGSEWSKGECVEVFNMANIFIQGISMDSN